MALPPTPRPPRLSRAAWILALYGLLTAAAFAWGLARHRWDIVRVPEAARWGAGAGPLVGLALGVAGALVVVFLSRYAEHRYQWARVLHREFRHVLGALGPGEVLLLAASSSVGEELFFRGAMLPDLGLVPTSVLFALPHIGPGARFLPWTAMALVLGLCLGALTLWTGDLAGAVAAHFVINLINLRQITRRG